jgi:hypothetical protein
MGASSSAAMSMFDKMIPSACADCVAGVSPEVVNAMARARPAAGWSKSG